MAALQEVDDETENFWRATSILLDEVPSKLRILFRQRWDEKYPAMPWDDTEASGDTFFKCEFSFHLQLSLVHV